MEKRFFNRIEHLTRPELPSRPAIVTPLPLRDRLHLDADEFDQPHCSSEVGTILLRAIDQCLHMTSSLAPAPGDDWQAQTIKHELSALLTQTGLGK